MSSEKPFGIKDKMGRELSLEQAKQVPVWRLPFPNNFQLEEGVVCLIHPKVEGYYGSLLSKSCRHGSGWAYKHDNGGTHFGKEYVSAYGQQVSPIQTVFGTIMELPRWLIEEVIPREYCNADGSLNIVEIGDASYVDNGKVLEGKPFVEVKKTSEGEYFIWLPDMNCMSGSLSERIFSKNKGLSSMHFKKDGTLLSFCYNECHYINDDINHEKFIKEFAAEQQAKLEKKEESENVSFGNKFELNLFEAMNALPIWRLADPTDYKILVEDKEIVIEIQSKNKYVDCFESNVVPARSVFSKETGCLLKQTITVCNPHDSFQNWNASFVARDNLGEVFSLPKWIYDEFLTYEQKRDRKFALWGTKAASDEYSEVLFEPVSEDRYNILLNPKDFLDDWIAFRIGRITVNPKTGEVIEVYYNGQTYDSKKTLTELYRELAKECSQLKKEEAMKMKTFNNQKEVDVPKWLVDLFPAEFIKGRFLVVESTSEVKTYDRRNKIVFVHSDNELMFYDEEGNLQECHRVPNSENGNTIKEACAAYVARIEQLKLVKVTASDDVSIELPKWFADALTEDEKQRLLSHPGLVQKTGGKPVLTYSAGTNTIGLRKPNGAFWAYPDNAIIDFNNDSPEKGLEKLKDYRKYVETNHVDDYKKIQEALKKTGYSTLYASFAIVASKPSDTITYHFYQDGKSLKEVYYRDSKGNLHNKIGPAFIEYGLNGLVKQEEFWLNGTKFANEDEWNKALVKSKQAKEEANKTENLEQEQSEKKDGSAKTIDNSLGGAAAAAGGLTMLAGVATLADKPSETTKSKGANTPVNMTMEKVKAIAISDSREVAKRIAVEKVSTIIRDLLINTMTANLKGKKKSQMMQTLATFFASEVGVATIQFMSGIGLPYIAPYLPEKYRGVVDEVSKELRIQGETKAAIEALGTIQPMIMMMVNGAMGSLSSLDAFVDETPVRVVTSAPATAHKEEEFAEVETASVAAIKKA